MVQRFGVGFPDHPYPHLAEMALGTYVPKPKTDRKKKASKDGEDDFDPIEDY